ncbi:UNVERIFIED_CONTAM: hypothetical protein RMT77_012918 [Armadillidium vulgare]
MDDTDQLLPPNSEVVFANGFIHRDAGRLTNGFIHGEEGRLTNGFIHGEEGRLTNGFIHGNEGHHDKTPTERNQYENTASTGITWYKATFLIVNAALGAGILNLPFAFDETGGIVPGNLAHAIFLSFATGSFIMLAICAMEKKCTTYQEVVHLYWGPKWGFVCSICITLYCFVACITFIIIIGDQFDRAFASYIGPDFCNQWYLNRKFTMVMSALLLIVPSCLKRIDGMEFMGYIGVASMIYLVIVIVLELFIGDYPKGEVNISNINVWKFFNVVPTISFAYQCHVSSVPIMSCVYNRSRSTILKACLSAMSICLVVYTLCANCGYLTFGSLVNPDVLLDYDASQLVVICAVLLLGLKAWMTYPILLFCVREAVADIYIRFRGLRSSEAESSEPKRRKIIACLLWICTIFFAVFIPGLNVVIKLLGSLAAVFILIFPGMCYLELTFLKETPFDLKSKWRFYAKVFVSILYIILGIFTFGLAMSLGVFSILDSKEEPPICEVVSHVQDFYAY